MRLGHHRDMVARYHMDPHGFLRKLTPTPSRIP
jgi:hypothetical protein